MECVLVCVWQWLEGGMSICGRAYRIQSSDLLWQQLSVSVLAVFWQYISMSIFTGPSLFEGNDIGLHLNRVHVQYLYSEWTIHKFQYHSQKSESQSIWIGKKYQVVDHIDLVIRNWPTVRQWEVWGNASRQACIQKCENVTVVPSPLRKQLIAFNLIINCRNVPLLPQVSNLRS